MIKPSTTARARTSKLDLVERLWVEVVLSFSFQGSEFRFQGSKVCHPPSGRVGGSPTGRASPLMSFQGSVWF